METMETPLDLPLVYVIVYSPLCQYIANVWMKVVSPCELNLEIL